MNAPLATIDVTLTIVKTDDGTGNTVGGKYEYIFVPDHVHVVQRDTEIVYSLTGVEKGSYRMSDLYTTDAREQFGRPHISEDGTTLTVRHRNTHKQLTVVSLFVQDITSNVHVPCDPQVSNDPPPQM